MYAHRTGVVSTGIGVSMNMSLFRTILEKIHENTVEKLFWDDLKCLASSTFPLANAISLTSSLSSVRYIHITHYILHIRNIDKALQGGHGAKVDMNTGYGI